MSEPLSNLPPEDMTAHKTIEPCWGQCLKDRQPSLTPADLIALRDEWRKEAQKRDGIIDGHWPELVSRYTAFSDCADQLDVLITRLSSEKEQEKKP